MEEVIAALVTEVQLLRKLWEGQREERLTVNFEEAGRMLGRSAKTISRMEKRGEIQTVLIGGDRMIPVEELKRIATPAEPQRRSGGPKKKEAYSLAEDLAKLKATKVR